MSFSPNSQLTDEALTMAFELRRRPANVMFHSDHGCHYTNRQFRQLIRHYQIKSSKIRRGNCWDNSPMERFFRSLKSEWVLQTGYRFLTEAKVEIINYITGYIMDWHQMWLRETTGLNTKQWPKLLDHYKPSR